jgi:hypothetical protein
VADVDAELADDRLAGDVGLKLVDDLGFDERPVAVGAVVGSLLRARRTLAVSLISDFSSLNR